MFLSVDGGGTKLRAILFDSDLKICGEGRSGGVNTTQNDPASVLVHIRECLDQVLPSVSMIKEAFVIFVGDKKLFEQELRSRVQVERITFFDEPTAGLIAGCGKYQGLIAISGTGSDVFYVGPDHRSIVGGWGIVLGDQGSGTWIGLKALRLVIRSLDDWGHDTLMTPLFLKHFEAEENPRKIVGAVYGAPAPFPVVARLVPLVAQAAEAGDPYALALFEDAGRVLGRQMLTLLDREHPPETEITLCGGCWKAHPLMYESFRNTVLEQYPKMQIHRPWFEHVMAGPMEYLLKNGHSREEARSILKASFPKEVIEA